MGKLTFGATGMSYQCDKVEVKIEGAPKCPKCQQSVYFNEEKKALGKTWHTKCFTCSKCNKRMDSTNYNQNNDDVLCTGCFRKIAGPRVYGFVSGASLPTVLDVEQSLESAGGLSLSAGSSTCSSPSGGEGGGGGGGVTNGRSASVSSAAVNRDDLQCCPSCGKKVYFAEELKAMRRKWHRQCFKCYSCSKSLEPGKCSEHQKQIYCTGCYGRQFGPRGYGYAGGNGSLLVSEVGSTSSSRPTTPLYAEQVTSQRYSFDYPQTASTLAHQNGNGFADYSQEPEVFETSEPIRGTREWTESVFTVPTTTGGGAPRHSLPARSNPGFYAPPAPAYAPPGHSSINERQYYPKEPEY